MKSKIPYSISPFISLIWQRRLSVLMAATLFWTTTAPAVAGEFVVFKKTYTAERERGRRQPPAGPDEFGVLAPQGTWLLKSILEGRGGNARIKLNGRPVHAPFDGAGVPVTLKSMNSLAVEVSGREGSEAEVTITGRDDKAPIVVWEQPTAGAVMPGGDMAATFRVRDDRAGVSAGGVAVTLDGADVSTQFTGISSATLNGLVSGQITALAGAHTLVARVSDLAGNVGVSTTTFRVNRAPVAVAGSSVTVTAGGVVALDGSASSDADGDALTYIWAFLTRPSGSAATLTGADTATPLFTADRAGDYVVRLVVSDGVEESAPDTVTVTARSANTAPVAEAGTAVTVTVGDVVALDGSASSDAEGTALTYVWDFQSRPVGSTATLTGADTATPLFTADRAGDYVVRLVVSDGVVESAPDTVTVTARAVNTAPMVNAGADQRVTATSAALNGSVTDDGLPVGGVLSVAWTAPGSAGVTFADAGSAATTVHFSTGGVYTLRLTATDGALTAWDETVVTVDLTPVDPTLPPDPATVAPPIDPTVATDLARATAFLYTGANPIQTGVSSGTIRAEHAAVVRGRVLRRDGGALSGAVVTVLDHPEYGATKSRADGGYDLAVNGGGALTLNMAKEGYLPAQRKVRSNWRDWSVVEDVALIPLDPAVTRVMFGTPESTMALGSTVTDERGTRRAAVYFPPNVGALIGQFPIPPLPLMELNIRATEYTVGANGPAAMPGELPTTTGYTYAVELSGDETGTQNVQFTQPVYVYVDNFPGFPVGETVPSGYYDRAKGAWVASENGTIVKVLGVTGGLADLDVDGSGGAADEAKLAALGVTEDERRRLGETYAAGKSVWRVPIQHMTPYDFNWPVAPPPGAEDPGEGPTPVPAPTNADGNVQDNPCREENASWVDCENQSLGETVPVTGTPFSLTYQSDRVWGRSASRTIEIPLTGAVLPAPLKRVDVEVNVAGTKWKQGFAPEASKSTTFVWDGQDRYGRPVRGYQVAEVTVSYVYDTVYMSVGDRLRAFGERRAYSVPLTAGPVEILKSRKTVVPVFSLTPAAAGLGGWMIDTHHAYQTHNQTLFLGDGSRRTSKGISLSGTVEIGRVTNAVGSFEEGYGLAADEAGDIYLQGLADAAKIRPDGTRDSLYGSLGTGYLLPGLPQPVVPGLAVVRPGASYVADVLNHQILKFQDGSIVGRYGWPGPSGYTITDNETFSWTVLSLQDMAYVFDAFLRQPFFPFDTDYEKLRKVLLAMGYTPEQVGGWPDGIALLDAYYAVAAGYGGDGVPAEGAKLLYPMGLATDAEGNLYIADTGNHRVRRVDANGIITTVAGNGQTDGFGNGAYGGDNGPATEAALNRPLGVAVDAAGNLYIADTDNHRIRKVDVQGIITTMAGDGQSGFTGDGGPATLARLNRPVAVAVDREGNLYISDSINDRVRRVVDGGMQTVGSFDHPTGLVLNGDRDLVVACRNGIAKKRLPPLPGYKTDDFLVPSEDGGEVYVFNAGGRHLKTLGSKTGALKYEFAYTPAGYLSTITDGDGNATTIERDGAGRPTAIVAPHGQRTELTTDADGWLTRVKDPAAGVHAMAYAAGGLMTSFTDPNGHAGTMSYDVLGRLAEDKAASGKTWASARSALSSGHEVSMTTAKGFVRRYTVEPQATGDLKRVMTSAWGGVSGILRRADGTTRVETPDGTASEGTKTADPRWGVGAALNGGRVTLPSGLTRETAVARTAVLGDAGNPMSLLTETTTWTVNGRNYVTVYSSGAKTLESLTPALRRAGRTLDARGRVVESRYATLAPLEYSYDVRGRVAGVRRGTRATSYDYNAGGYLSGVTDAVGRRVGFEQDALGRVTRQTMPDGRAVEFAYDANGNVTGVTPPGRGAHVFTYGAGDLPKTYTAPLGGVTQYAYDEDAELKTVTRPDGELVAYERDVAGRLASVTTGAGVVEYAYDGAGRVGGVTAPGGVTLTHSYDGDLLTGTEWAGPVAGRVERTYDADFHVKTQSVNGGGVGYAYDEDGLMTGAGDLTLARDAQTGQVTGTTLGVVTDAWTYTALGEAATYGVTAGGTPVYGVAYARDGLGRITGKTETVAGVTAAWAYAYDLTGRLVTVSKDGAVVEEYAYDLNGNRISGSVGGTTTNSTYDGEDRLVTAGARTYTHSANGELKTVTEGADTWTYGYDALGNLRTAAGPSGTAIEYVIDGRNRRVGRKVNGVLTKGYLWSSGLRVEAELDGGGNVTARYVYGLKSNVPEWMLKGGEKYRIITDHLGSPRLVVNATNGAIAQRMDYDSWGNITSDSNPGFQPFGFAGGLYDQDTKLTRFGARDYDALTGRWTAKDPIGFNGRDTNLYAYVGHDPVNRKDARGLWTMGNMGGTLGVGPNINVPVTVPVRDVVPGPVPQPGKLPCDDAVVPNGNYSEGEEGEKEKKKRRLPAKGKPNSTEVIDNEDGTGQIRDYGPDGNAETDYDFGHHPELGDPHAHDWDWENNPPRGLPRPLRPGE